MPIASPKTNTKTKESPMFKIEKNVGGIEGLCVLTPTIHPDERGYFFEAYNKRDYEAAALNYNFVQDNESCSTKGVLRGLHYQKNFPQAKLVRVVSGTVWDVAVDLRESSRTFGSWYGLELSGENKKQFLIPRGFAHGFLVLSREAIFCYKCDDFYHPGDEGHIRFDDARFAITWPKIDCPIILSEKDKAQ